MNKIEQELFDLEELLMRNDDVADRSIYITIGGIANNVSELESENAKLREMLAEDNEELAKMRRVIDYLYSFAKSCGVDAEDMRELGVEVDG